VGRPDAPGAAVRPSHYFPASIPDPRFLDLMRQSETAATKPQLLIVLAGLFSSAFDLPPHFLNDPNSYLMNKFAIGCGGIVVILLFILIVAALALGGIYNRLVRLQQSVDQSWAQVQNVYQRRADLIPNLVNTVSGAANFEKSTIVEVTNARASVGQVKIDPNKAPTDPAQLEQFQAAQGQLSNALSRLLVVVERYPELKANQNFLTLQAQLEGTENRISVERGNFNSAVQNYNTAVRSVPANFVAGMFGFAPRPFFTAQPGAEKAPPVNFNFGTPAPSPVATP
jgi:LemA protein